MASPRYPLQMSPRRAAQLLVVAALLVGVLVSPRRADAQGCIPGRSCSSVIGARVDPYLRKGQLQLSIDYRYTHSDRHFIGDEEDEQRALEGSQVITSTHQITPSLTYALTKRFNLAFAVPILISERSNPLRDPTNGEVVGRHLTRARGFGDMSLTARAWVLDPLRFTSGNVSLGAGLKLPTAGPALDTRRRIVGTEVVTDVVPVDQAIQLGDGGFGLQAELSAFKHFGDLGLYLSGLYLFNPQNTNGTLTYIPTPGQGVMSITDSFIVRGGVSYGFALPGELGGLSASLGTRFEGVPVKDVLGESDGFRRPGHILSIDPGVAYAKGDTSIAFFLPIAVYRNREQSEADRTEGGRGDAAFADYLVTLDFSQRF